MAVRKAYFIAGHGADGTDAFIVPEGCIIVAKQVAGELGYMPDAFEHFRHLNNLPQSIIVQPDIHSEEIVKTFGSVAIYKPGDICPNFIYDLVACYPLKSNVCIDKSGVIEIKEQMRDRVYTEDYESIEDTTAWNHESSRFASERMDKIKDIVDNAYTEMYEEIVYMFEAMFEHSVYPTKNDIKQIINENEFTDQLTKHVVKLMQYYKDKINTTTRTTQKDLCERFPGVYYNFVCRYTATRSNVFEYNTTIGKNLIKLNSRGNIGAAPRNLLNAHLEESLFYRKPGVMKWYNTYGRPAENMNGSWTVVNRRKTRKSKTTRITSKSKSKSNSRKKTAT